ncbi:MAG TPA: hypothetical protein VIY48_04100 [Candidatus Paceibacterota bacterium]
MINAKQAKLARAIDRARRESNDPNYQLGVRHVAHAIADDTCTGEERLHFLLACGVDFNR